MIDIFSRYAWSVPLKGKTGTSSTSASKSLFQNRKPITIQSDKGIEFANASARKYLKCQGVNFYTTHNPEIKGAVTKRFNKSPKTRMYKYNTKNNTFRYLDFIDKLLTSYNNSVHSTIGMTPSKVTPSNNYCVCKRMNSFCAKIPQGRVKYKV